MPTPFMHLDMAEKILAFAQQQPQHQPLANWLHANWSAFYFGSIAPDYPHTTSDSRESSHFYNIPPNPQNDAYSTMLRQHPTLQYANISSAEQAAFTAAYCAHLLLDLIWFREILVPHFFNAAAWGNRQETMTAHFILLTHLDRLAFARLPATAQATLAKTAVSNPLPFTTNQTLHLWRQLILEQLAPHQTPKTAQIYAQRLNITPQEFLQRLEDPRWMQENLFDKVPVQQITQRLETAVPQSIHLLEDYVNSRIPHHD